MSQASNGGDGPFEKLLVQGKNSNANGWGVLGYPAPLVTNPQYWSIVDAILGSVWASVRSSFGFVLAQPFLF